MGLLLLVAVLYGCSSTKVSKDSSSDWVRITNGNLWLTAEGDTVQAFRTQPVAILEVKGTKATTSALWVVATSLTTNTWLY